MTWTWTGHDKKQWEHLRHVVTNALDQADRRPSGCSRGMLAELRRACANVMRAAIPTNDAQEVGAYRRFLDQAQAYAAGSAAGDFAQLLERVGGMLDGRPAPPAQRRLPYADD